MQPQPHLIQVPDDRGLNRVHVWLRRPGGVSDVRLGHVHETAGAGVVATWVDDDGNDLIGMPGFATLDAAADALYWFDAPYQSIRSRNELEAADSWVNGTITFRASDVEGAVTAIHRAAGALLDGNQGWKDAGRDHNVQLHARNNG